nr:molecular chaperone Hsp90 [Phaeacidiphilus oryzae]
MRHRVLAAWAASPARFREDANAEEELALGGYRDRLVVELAQNAADAAARAGRPGRLRLTLRDGVLAAANSGAPLDGSGVESLSTLRASAKRAGDEGTVGRFGVGFSAVLAVSDEPAVLSTSGGVRWSMGEARAAIEGLGDRTLLDEVRRRDGHVPLLRLPLPAGGTPPDGYDTVVVLPLRDGAAGDLARRLLQEVDDALLLTLPQLDEVVVEIDDGPVRVLRRESAGPEGEGPTEVAVAEQVGDGEPTRSRWQVVADSGSLESGLLADRPVEERLRPWWSVTWAVPVDEAGRPRNPRTPPVVHAPTPSDEPLGLPALLIATLPLDSTRRHVARGPLTDFVLARAAEAYARLVRERGPRVDSLDLVPGPLGKGELDGALRAQVLERLAEVPFLPAAEPAGPTEGPEGPEEDGAEAIGLRPGEAVLLQGADRELVAAVASVLPGMLPAGLERRPELRTLGVRRLPLAEVVDQLSGLDRPPSWWRLLYAALAGADPEPLGALPVPLADGRTVTGPRRVLVPATGAAAEAEWGADPAETPLADDLARLGLRVVHPEAAHPLLERLGAGVAVPAGVLAAPELRSAVERSLEIAEDDPERAEELADAVLRVVRAAGARPGEYPWLARLALSDEEGEPAPAGELVLPDSPWGAVVDEEDAAFVGEEWVERWGGEVLAAAGVAAAPVLVRAAEAVLDPDDLERLDPTAEPDRAAGGEPTGLIDESPDGLAEWAEEVLDTLEARGDGLGGAGGPEGVEVPPVAVELAAVRDLDLVAEEAWPEALAMLAVPPLRYAVTEPVVLRLPDGGSTSVRPYTAWWLRDHPVLDGRRPAGLRAAGSDPLLRGLYEEAGTPLDEEFLHALGVRTSLAALLAEPFGADELLERLADPQSVVTHRQLHGLYSALAQVDAMAIGGEPAQVRALPAAGDGEPRRAEGTAVVDAELAVIADAPDLMQLLDGVPVLPVAPVLAGALAERLRVPLASEVAGGRVLTEGDRRPVPPAVRALLPENCPGEYEEHEELLVVGVDGGEAPVDWRWDGEELHAATPEGLAAGLAWASGQWVRRFELLTAIGDPGRSEELVAERDFEG